MEWKWGRRIAEMMWIRNGAGWLQRAKWKGKKSFLRLIVSSTNSPIITKNAVFVNMTCLPLVYVFSTSGKGHFNETLQFINNRIFFFSVIFISQFAWKSYSKEYDDRQKRSNGCLTIKMHFQNVTCVSIPIGFAWIRKNAYTNESMEWWLTINEMLVTVTVSLPNCNWNVLDACARERETTKYQMV